MEALFIHRSLIQSSAFSLVFWLLKPSTFIPVAMTSMKFHSQDLFRRRIMRECIEQVRNTSTWNTIRLYIIYFNLFVTTTLCHSSCHIIYYYCIIYTHSQHIMRLRFVCAVNYGHTNSNTKKPDRKQFNVTHYALIVEHCTLATLPSTLMAILMIVIIEFPPHFSHAPQRCRSTFSVVAIPGALRCR